jgi:plastocyanin
MRVAVAGMALVGAGVLGASGAGAADKAVSMKNIKFNPDTVTVNVGDKVTWTNNEGLGGPNHTVHSDEVVELNSPTVVPGNTYTFTFAKAGTVNYYCTIHGKATMSGAVTVKPVATTLATTSTTARPITATTVARTTTSTAKATTTTETQTTETLALDTTTSEETTTTGNGQVAIKTSGGGTNGFVVALLVLGILGVLGAGGYAIYRMQAGRF